MGLTIHYKMKFNKNWQKAVEQVCSLRQFALKLPFKSVSGSRFLTGKEQANFENYQNNKPSTDFDPFWFLIQSQEHLKVGNMHYGYSPEYVFGFEAYPGDGCEVMNIGACVYPKTIVREKKTFKTGEQFPRWSSFCKTQYASDPRYGGGVPNFIKCHLLVIQTLDEAIRLGIDVEVSDESDYFIHRDLEKLVREVADWNEMIAAFVGGLKDACGDGEEIVAPITEYPNFERLEVRGNEKIKSEQ